MGTRARGIGWLGAGALLIVVAAGCKTPDGTSPPEPKEEHPAVEDVVLRGCGVDAEGHGRVTATITNHSLFPARYSVQVRFGDADEPARYGGGQATSAVVDAGATADLEVPSLEPFVADGRCTVEDVTRLSAS